MNVKKKPDRNDALAQQIRAVEETWFRARGSRLADFLSFNASIIALGVGIILTYIALFFTPPPATAAPLFLGIIGGTILSYGLARLCGHYLYRRTRQQYVDFFAVTPVLSAPVWARWDSPPKRYDFFLQAGVPPLVHAGGGAWAYLAPLAGADYWQDGKTLEVFSALLLVLPRPWEECLAFSKGTVRFQGTFARATAPLNAPAMKATAPLTLLAHEGGFLAAALGHPLCHAGRGASANRAIAAARDHLANLRESEAESESPLRSITH